MKRKTGNRMLTTGLVLAMTAGMLAGCGNSAPAAVTDNASADTEALACPPCWRQHRWEPQ